MRCDRTKIILAGQYDWLWTENYFEPRVSYCINLWLLLMDQKPRIQCTSDGNYLIKTS